MFPNIVKVFILGFIFILPKLLTWSLFYISVWSIINIHNPLITLKLIFVIEQVLFKIYKEIMSKNIKIATRRISCRGEGKHIQQMINNNLGLSRNCVVHCTHTQASWTTVRIIVWTLYTFCPSMLAWTCLTFPINI